MSFEQSSSFYQSSSDDVLAGGYEGAYGEDFQGGVVGGVSSYEAEYGAGEALAAASGDASGEYYSSSSIGGGLNVEGASNALVVSGGAYGSGAFGQQVAQYAADAQGLYQDPNPQVIRRPAPGGPHTYTQRVQVRFLQPPPVPAPGPLIIKEVRPPQPPPPPPLFIRQRPPPPPVLPPIVIREAPPRMPPAVPAQVLTKMLPAIPVPPRSVIIERLPPLPPKPRDIIVERWLPYRVQHKRRVIIQRAPPPVLPKPRNIIIYYEPPKAQVVRRFINMGISRANPAEYVARYGTQLEDSTSLLTHARQAGVVEDITPPGGVVSGYQVGGLGGGFSTVGGAGYGVSSGLATLGGSGYEISGDLSTVGGAAYTLGSGAGYSLGSGAGYSLGGGASYSLGSGAGYALLGGTGGYSSSFESSGGDLGLVGYTTGLGGGSSNYETYSSEQIYG